MNTITASLLSTLSGDATLEGYLGAASRILRSWPHGTPPALSSSLPAYLILQGPSTTGNIEADGQALDIVTYQLHIFAIHSGYGQAHINTITERIKTLLNLTIVTSASKKTGPISVNPSELDLYSETDESHHGVVTLQIQGVFDAA